MFGAACPNNCREKASEMLDTDLVRGVRRIFARYGTWDGITEARENSHGLLRKGV